MLALPCFAGEGEEDDRYTANSISLAPLSLLEYTIHLDIKFFLTDKLQLSFKPAVDVGLYPGFEFLANPLDIAWGFWGIDFSLGVNYHLWIYGRYYH